MKYYIIIYQLPLIQTALLHVDLINVATDKQNTRFFCFLISRLRGKPGDSISVLEALPVKLDIKRLSPSILYIVMPLCVYNALTETA